MIEDELGRVEQGPKDVLDGASSCGARFCKCRSSDGQLLLRRYSAEGGFVDLGDDLRRGLSAVRQLPGASGGVSELGLEPFGIHEVEGLHHAQAQVTFARAIGAGIGASEGVQEMGLDLVT